MIDVYEFFQNPVLCNDTLEDDNGDAHIVDFQQFIDARNTEDNFWPFGYDAA